MSHISLSGSERASPGSISLHDRTGREEAHSFKPAAQEQKASLTSRELRVRNRYLGYMATILIAVILGYFIIYIFLIGRLFIEQTKTVGVPFVGIQGRAYYDSDHNLEIWQLSSQIAAQSQSGTTFPTRLRITKGQKIGTCPTPLLPCKKASECNPSDFPNLNLKGQCNTLTDGKKACVVNDWCPAENIDDSDTTEIINLEGVTEQKLYVKSIMSFPGDPNNVFRKNTNTKFIDYPQDNANSFSVENLLTLASTNYESIKYIGCVLELNIIWNCDLDLDQCTNHYEVNRVDGGAGYSQKHANYDYDSGTTTRDLIHYSGVKVVVTILGISERISIFSIFLYFFIAISLIYGIQLGTDFFLLHIAREKRHYSELKFENLRPDRR